MSLFWGKFNPINESEMTDEIRDLYRIRDLTDPKIQKYKGLQVNRQTIIPELNLDDKASYRYQLKYMIPFPNDDVYESMTEEEKVENGLPTRYTLFFSSLPGVLFLGLCTCNILL